MYRPEVRERAIEELYTVIQGELQVLEAIWSEQIHAYMVINCFH